MVIFQFYSKMSVCPNMSHVRPYVPMSEFVLLSECLDKTRPPKAATECEFGKQFKFFFIRLYPNLTKEHWSHEKLPYIYFSIILWYSESVWLKWNKLLCKHICRYNNNILVDLLHNVEKKNEIVLGVVFKNKWSWLYVCSRGQNQIPLMTCM